MSKRMSVGLARAAVAFPWLKSVSSCAAWPPLPCAACSSAFAPCAASWPPPGSVLALAASWALCSWAAEMSAAHVNAAPMAINQTTARVITAQALAVRTWKRFIRARLERVKHADHQREERKAFDQRRCDDHGRLNAAGNFRLAGHAFDRRGGQAADAQCGSDDGQADAHGAAGQNERRCRRRRLLSHRRGSQT